MSNEINMKNLTKIESDTDILNYRFSFRNMLMWPFLRHYLFLNIHRYGLKIDYPKTRRKFIPQRLVPYIANSIKDTPLNIDCPFDILIFSHAAGNVPNDKGGFFNKVYEHFAAMYKTRTLFVERSHRMQYPKPREFPNIKSHDTFFLQAHLKSKFVKTNDKDLKTIDSFIQYLKNAIPIKLNQSIWDEAKKELIIKSKWFPILYTYYSELYKKSESKLVALHTGSYGNFSFIIKWAKEFGIPTAEFQHGSIGPNHIAYNYADNIIKSEYNQYLPDYFLCFGDYWANKINTSSKIITVGRPYIIECAKKSKLLEKNFSKKRILFVSSGGIPEKIRDTVIELYNKIEPEKYQIIFRPHIAEIPLLKKRYKAFYSMNIEIDTREDIYALFELSNMVVSVEETTVLYEAMLFDVPIFVWNDASVKLYTDPNIFIPYNNIDELYSKINGEVHRHYETDKFYDRHWETRYKNFIEKTIKIIND